MKITIIPKSILKTLLFLVLLLSVGNICSIILIFLFNQERFGIIISMLNFNFEYNIPTLFSSLNLGICSLLTYYISIHQKKNKKFKYWLFLSVIFLFLSLDEALMIHERIGKITREHFSFTGFLYYAWVLPYGILSALVFLYLRHFLTQLPTKFRNLFLLSGFIYIIGALGFEMMGAAVDFQLVNKTKFNLIYNILYSIEETLEMLGIILFIYALLKYISFTHTKPIKISFDK